MSDGEKLLGKIGVVKDDEPQIKEPIFVKLSSYKNSKYLDVRKYYQKNEEWLPTPKGITLQQDQIEDLIKIIENNKDIIKEWFDK